MELSDKTSEIPPLSSYLNLELPPRGGKWGKIKPLSLLSVLHNLHSFNARGMASFSFLASYGWVCFAHVCPRPRHTQTPRQAHKHTRTRRHNYTLICHLTDARGPLCNNMCALSCSGPRARRFHHFQSFCWQFCSCCLFRTWHQLFFFPAVMRPRLSVDWRDAFPHIWLAFVYIHFIYQSIWCGLIYSRWAFLFVPKD